MTALDLASSVLGEGERPLVVLHGLFGSGRNWKAVAKALAPGRTVHLVDLRNHGASPWASTMAYGEMAGDVLEYLEKNDLFEVDLVGHSMGGKTAMALALGAGGGLEKRLRRLVLVDIAPVAYSHSHGDLVAAMEASGAERAKNRGEVDEALSTEVEDAGLRAFLLQNLVRDGGHYRWRLNLEAIASAMPLLTGFPEALGSSPLEVLVLAGASSAYVRDDDLPAFRGHFPTLALERIEGAGHWVHAEKPADVVAAIERFLGRGSAISERSRRKSTL